MGSGQLARSASYVQPRANILGLAAGSAALAGGGILMIRSGQTLGWFAAGLFALAVPLLLAGIWRPTAILLDEERITVRTPIGSWGYEWREIADVGIWEHKRYGMALNRLVTLRLRSPQSRTREGFARLFGSGHATLPSVGVDVHEMLDAVTSFWQRALSSNQDETP
ncbi:MAG: hypothetical protein GY925_29830 [Actinomycetia bacterium]|nr:hypothetical protein [Actinomycetes bacterium]